MNKDKNTAEYLKRLESLKLSESSRVRLQGNLLEYARFHSVKEGVRVDEEGRSIEQVPQRTSLFTLFKQPKSMTAAIIAIMLIAGGGTSYAAESAIPGDFLYTVKTDVNENVKSAFAGSNEAKARLQAQLAEERLAEAEELAARGELSAETSADISTRIKAHVQEAENRSAKAEAGGDYEYSAIVRASLEGSFRAHADVLADLNTRVSGNNGESLVTDVRGYADAAAEAQVNATATIDAAVDMKAAAEATMNRADSYIAEVESKLTQVESKISAEAYARAEAKLAEAVAVQAQAQASFRTETYRAAYTAAETSVRITSEVEATIHSMLRLQVDMNVDTEAVIDNVLDVSTESNTRTNSDSNTNTTQDRDTQSSGEAGTITDTNVDTDVIDVEVQTDTSIRSGLNL